MLHGLEKRAIALLWTITFVPSYFSKIWYKNESMQLEWLDLTALDSLSI
jgi:hypothetical protein